MLGKAAAEIKGGGRGNVRGEYSRGRGGKKSWPGMCIS